MHKSFVFVRLLLQIGKIIALYIAIIFHRYSGGLLQALVGNNANTLSL